MPWIKVTGGDGNSVYISTEQVVCVKPPAGGEAPGQAKAIVVLTNGSQATRESVDDIMKLLAAGGG